MASSSVVLPWSTWPMMVTTGGRDWSDVRLVLERDLLGLLVGGVPDLDLALELAADQLDRLVAQRLRDLHHLVRRHQERDDLGRRDAELLGEILDGDPRRDADGPGRNLGLASLLLARSAALAPLTGACGRPGRRSRRGGGLAETPPAAGGRGGRAGPVQTAARRPSRRRRAGPLRRRRRRARPDRRLGGFGRLGGLGGGLCRRFRRGLGLLLLGRLLRHYVSPSMRPSGRSMRTCSARSAGSVSEHFSRRASAPRRRACPAHAALGQRYTPRPPRRRSRSTTAVPRTAHSRTRLAWASRRPQPAHWRTGSRPVTEPAPRPPPAPGGPGRRSNGFRRGPGSDSACRTM